MDTADALNDERDDEFTEPAYYASLNNRQRRFVEEYCIDFNATQAAIRSGYSENEASAATIGYRLLRNVEISKAISLHMAALTMTAGEAMHRLTQWGRGSIAPFMKVSESGEMAINLTHPEARRHFDLIKKVKQRKTIVQTEERVIETIDTEIELHDAKDAVKQILQVQGKLVLKHEHSGPDGGPIKTDNTDRRTWNIINHAGGHHVPSPDEDYNTQSA